MSTTQFGVLLVVGMLLLLLSKRTRLLVWALLGLVNIVFLLDHPEFPYLQVIVIFIAAGEVLVSLNIRRWSFPVFVTGALIASVGGFVMGTPAGLAIVSSALLMLVSVREWREIGTTLGGLARRFGLSDVVGKHSPWAGGCCRPCLR